MIRSLLAVVLFLQCCGAALAGPNVIAARGTMSALTKSMSFSELMSNAGIVFQGKLTKLEYGNNGKVDVRTMTFEITDPIKGLDSKQKTITLNEIAALRSPMVTEVKENTEYVFFFHSPSSIGLTSLCGLEQGLVPFDKAGAPMVNKRVVLQTKGLLKPSAVKTSADAYQEAVDLENLKNYNDLKEVCNKYMD